MKNIEIKKRYGIKVIAVTTAFALTVSGLTGCAKKDSSSTAAAATAEETQSSEELENQLNEAIGSGNVDDDNESSLSDPGAAPSKNEVVYIMADANGNCDKVVVSDWIKNTKGNSEVADVSDLKDITNTKGNAKYDLDSNGNLTWNADGKDVHYQGTTDKKPPVSVKVSYKLDGKDISPKDIAGKSGKVTIRFDYTNNETKKVVINGKEEEIKVPFAMVSGLMLDSKKFTNVKVTNGKQLDSGKSDMIVGMAFPGLSESIDLDGMKDKAVDEDAKKKVEDIQIPEYFEITANVKDFELQQTMTMASSDVLSQLDMTSDTIDTSSLTDSMDELSKGMNDLEDGGTQLQKGTTDLVKGTGDLKKGTSELSSRSKDLDDGAGKLQNGAKQLGDGAKSLNDGSTALSSGLGSIDTGAGSLSSGLSDLDNGAGSLKDGADKLSAGTQSLASGAGKLDSGASDLSAGVDKLSSGIDTALGPNSAIKQGTQQADSAAEQLDSFINEYFSSEKDNVELLSNEITAIKKQQAQTQQLMTTYSMEVQSAQEEYDDAEQDLIEAVQGTPETLKVMTGTKETQLSVKCTASGNNTGSNSDTDPAKGTDSSSTSSESSTASSGSVTSGDGSESTSSTTSLASSGTDGSDTQTGSGTDTTSDSVTGTTAYSGTDSGNDSKASGQSDDLSSAIVAGITQSSNDEDGLSDGSEGSDGSITVDTPVIDEQTVNTVDQEKVNAAVTRLKTANNALVTASSRLGALQGQQDSLAAEAQKIQYIITNAKQQKSSLTVPTDNTAKAYYLEQLSGQLKSGIDGISAGEDTAYSMLSGKDSMGALKTGVSQLKSGTSEAVSGAASLNNGAAQLAGGAGSLKDGADKALSGVKTLKDGTASAYSGSVTLMNGTNSLMTGSDSLLSGTGDLKTGTTKLVSGTKDLDDGAGKLDDGVSKLAEGVNDLTDGLFKFDDEGISKLTDMFGDNVTDVVDRLKAVEDAGSDYTSFTGASDNMVSNVKFVYKTDAITASDEK